MKKILSLFQKLTIQELIFYIYEKFYLVIYSKIFIKKIYSSKGDKSFSDDGYYVSIVKSSLRNEKIFYKFKRNPIYRTILEHLTFKEGEKYISKIIQDNLIDLSDTTKYILNDKVGYPIKFYYKECRDTVSPTTLSYLSIISDLKKNFNFKFKNIAEIGCGYGGQYLLIDQYFDIDNYTLADLPEVNLLIKKYLSKFQLNSNYKFIEEKDLYNEYKFDFVISNYAFSELPTYLQKLYLKSIIKNSKNGYMVMNSGTEKNIFQNHLSLNEIKKYIPNMRIIDEIPLTAKGNYIITWNE